MTDSPPSRRPNGITGLGGEVIDALKTSPVLLLIVLLNMAFAGSAAYYLSNIENKRSEATKLILDRCIPYAADHRKGADNND
jgi:hypothetical protein